MAGNVFSMSRIPSLRWLNAAVCTLQAAHHYHLWFSLQEAVAGIIPCNFFLKKDVTLCPAFAERVPFFFFCSFSLP
jgi:uncharacterized protein YdeI (YjbR/CyaY-like superfamily)